jgi:Icc-related predicted phosphoesterase
MFIIDQLLLFWRKMKWGLKEAIFIGGLGFLAVMTGITYMVYNQYGPITAIFLVLTVTLTLYRRLNKFPGYGTPVLNTRHLLKSQLVSAGKAVRVCIISDTHNTMRNQHQADRLPDADILIHCGDITTWGTIEELKAFNEFLGLVKKRYAYIIVIAGNHDIICDSKTYQNNLSLMSAKDRDRHTQEGAESLSFFAEHLVNGNHAAYDQALRTKIFTNVTHYLVNENVAVKVSLKNGNTHTLRICGSPCTELQAHAWQQAFARSETDQLNAFHQSFKGLTSSPDIFMCHGPARNALDKTFFQKHVGSAAVSRFLVKMTKENKAPKIFAHGHIHERRGFLQPDTLSFKDILKGTGAENEGVVAVSTNNKKHQQQHAKTSIPSMIINAASISLNHKLRPNTSGSLLEPGCAVLVDIEC